MITDSLVGAGSSVLDGPRPGQAILRGGIIGCGYFGQIHIEAWGRMADVHIVAASDSLVSRASGSGRRGYEDAARMMAEEPLDFVDIATRDETHAELLSLAVAKRIPVICQKPLAPTWHESVRMVELAERADLPFMVHENWRWQPWYRAVKALLDEGAIGRPVSYCLQTRCNDGAGPAPYTKQEYFRTLPRLLIHETLVHHLDTARFLFGEIATVRGQARRINPVIRGEDQALITVTHESELSGVIDGHRFSDTDPPGPVMGMAQIDGDRGTLRIEPTGHVYLGARRVWQNTVEVGYRGDSVRATQQHFISSLRRKTPFESGARAYLKTIAAVEATYLSIAQGRSVAPAELFASDP